MDASAAGAGAGQPGVAPQTSIQNAARKEWRVVSEHHSSSDGELDRSKGGQSDERTIYEQGREPADVDFCSITIDGGLENDMLQRLHNVARQREELQQMEVELRAQVIVRSEIMELQSRFEAQVKEHANNAAMLQEQLSDRDQTIREYERRMEEKDREIHAIKLDNEAAWAQEGLLREQNKELASFRRDRDNSEAERAQHFQQIHDLQEHIKDKERQLLELQEQQRVAQETIIYKDEQLREAQAWITRAQEMDAIHSATNLSLQAELRERTEQYNQLWVGCQRQFSEMERVHAHAIQKLQRELTETRERNGTHKEESLASHSSAKDAPQYGHENGHHNVSANVAPNGTSSVILNGNGENATNFLAAGNVSQAEHLPGVNFTPSIYGISPYLSPGQMAVHPYMVQQGVLNPAGHFPSMPANSSIQYWQNQQVVTEGSQSANHDQFQPSEAAQKNTNSGSHYDETPVNGQSLPSEHVEPQSSQGATNGFEVPSSAAESQDQKLMGNTYLVEPQTQHDLQELSSQFNDNLKLSHLEENKSQDNNVSTANENGVESRQLLPQSNSSGNAVKSDAPVQLTKYREVATVCTDTADPEAIISPAQTKLPSLGKSPDSLLLDERSLLACIARTMPASGKIRISSTLPNRLGKMLAPLHWHDYKKVHGKLDDFVAGHPELFVIEGDFIQLREGAQKKIAATAAAAKVAAAAAKVAAAAAASSPYSSVLPSVAVTPMAQSYRLKKILSNELDHNSHPVEGQTLYSNGIHSNAPGGQSGSKAIPNSNNHLDFNGSENRYSRTAVSMTTENGANVDRSSYPQTLGSTNARMPVNSAGRSHGRAPGAAPNARR